MSADASSTKATKATNTAAATADGHETPQFTPFLPLFLLAASLLVFLVWQFTCLSRERSTLQQGIEERAKAVSQAPAAKERLEKLAVELLGVAQTSAEARKIVAKYNIQFTPHQKQGEPAAP